MTPTKVKYVVGFIFSKDKSRILLIRKDKPQWQVGKFNGIGGKVNPQEYLNAAMVRECHEETGLYVPSEKWIDKGMLFGIHYHVQIYTYFATEDELAQAEGNNTPTTKEPVKVFHLNELDGIQTISQLKWLVPLILDNDVVHINIQQKPKE